MRTTVCAKAPSATCTTKLVKAHIAELQIRVQAASASALCATGECCADGPRWTSH